MASPLVSALRQRYPQARISWLIQPESYDLLAANEQLDEIIVWQRGQWRDLWRQRRIVLLLRQIYGFIVMLRGHHFDLVLDIQGLMKSGIWAWCTGARQRIGLGSREGSARLMTRVVSRPKNDDRIGSEYREIARQLALDTQTFNMRIALAPDDLAYSKQFCQQHHLHQGYIVICPFTTRPQKHWSEGHWINFIKQAYEQLSLPVVMLGGPGDVEAGKRLDCGQSGLINVTGQTRLRQAAAIIANARLLVGVDTGLTHMGIAAAIPVITLFGSTCPYQDTGQDTTVVLYKAMECSPCRRNPTCGGAFTCMTDISVADVLESANQLLNGSINENPAC